MASQRLTESLKESIIANMKKSLFRDKVDALQGKRKLLALDIYNEHYSDSDKKFMASAPLLAFVYLDEIKITCKAANIFREYLPLPDAYPFFFGDANSNRGIVFEEPTDLIGKYMEIGKKLDKLDKEMRDLARATRVAMSGITTLKKLTEAWPEVTNYLSTPETVEYLPALPFSSINQMISSAKKGEEA